jgi:hypothetical protein
MSGNLQDNQNSFYGQQLTGTPQKITTGAASEISTELEKGRYRMVAAIQDGAAGTLEILKQ